MEYINPCIKKYKNIDELLKNKSASISLFDQQETKLVLEDLKNESFVCIVGEPGIGKSRLLKEFISLDPESIPFFYAIEFNSSKVDEKYKYCVIDALDEVDTNKFTEVLKSIIQYKSEHPSVNVLFSCRKHYVESYIQHFLSCNGLCFVELCRLKENDVDEIIKNCNEKTQSNVKKSPKLLDLLSIPRYLDFFIRYNNEKYECTDISDLFEYIIHNAIKIAIKNYNGLNGLEDSVKILVQRILEKIAFIMEISRKDHISKDELYSILDGIRGNMSQIILTNFDLLYFESRILKDTNGILQFENSEIQEYLAAKELCRQDNIESVLFDVAYDKELKHIYPNWYDVIPHIANIENNGCTFVNVFKLIISSEEYIGDKSFETLLKYVNPSLLSKQDKCDLFNELFVQILKKPVYFCWGTIPHLMGECYSINCKSSFKFDYCSLNKIQQSNLRYVIGSIVEHKLLDDETSEYLKKNADTLMLKEDEDSKIFAIDIYNALELDNRLISLSSSFKQFSIELKNRYCDATGSRYIVNKEVADCWIEWCYNRKSSAINAILSIKDPTLANYVYSKIIENQKFSEFFNPDSQSSVMYEFFLQTQFENIWDSTIDVQLSFSKIVAAFVKDQYHYTTNEIDEIVKPILQNEQTGLCFINFFDNEWNLYDFFKCFDAKYVDLELIKAFEKIISSSQCKHESLEDILIVLIDKIRNDKEKKKTILAYITKYSNTFDTWDKNNIEANNRDSAYLKNVYEILLKEDVSLEQKFEVSYKLCNNIDYLKKIDADAFVSIIKSFFENLNLDELTLKKNGEFSFSMSNSFIKIPRFVQALYELGYRYLLSEYRMLFAKLLPIIDSTINYTDPIKTIYKSIIGEIDDKEKTLLVKWWKERSDDYMCINPNNVITCISEYGIDALLYKLLDYINEHINNQESNKIYASKALDLIKEKNYDCDFINPNNLKCIFNKLTDDRVDSIKIQCNEILIEKFQDKESIDWRFNYLKTNIVKFNIDNSVIFHSLKPNELEVISANPIMFRCFWQLKNVEFVNDKMLDLFDFGLNLCNQKDTERYGGYLMGQIYQFFIKTEGIKFFPELRKKVENQNVVSNRAFNIMNFNEISFLTENVGSKIEKSISMYNKCVEKSYLPIRNDSDLRHYFSYIYIEVQKEIQDQGIYSLVRQDSLSEDFIQRELKNTIINKCCQLGLDVIKVDREVTLQDNKRTDLLIRYGLCNPIMIELKLLHNKEIQIKKYRQDYKAKFLQYTRATNACLSVFWVFDVHEKNGKREKFESLKSEYIDLKNTRVILTDCKCSSGFDTGLPKMRRKKI